MGRKEHSTLEFKREVTKTFLKTVSAFSNYSGGQIVFGVDDHGVLVGIDQVDDECLKIEHMINDSIDPSPNFQLQVETIDNSAIITLTVLKGSDTPYYYQRKVYSRSNTSTVEVDRFELRRLAMEGLNMDYEQRQSSSQELDFTKLESRLQEKTGITSMSLDILKTLNVYAKEGYYNVAAELLADENEFTFSGLDIVKFGKDPNTILYRETISKKSLLTQYERAIELFKQYYQYEEIQGYHRVQQELIPKEAFREALANAIVHRVWDINSYIQIAMYEDRLEINSPGGLPEGISEEEYLFGNISVLRNPILAGVFYRLDIIEKFGTGIGRINTEYGNSTSKPSFVVSKNSIQIVLPVLSTEGLALSEDELTIVNLLEEDIELTRKELDEKSGFAKSRTLRVIQRLIENKIVQRLGKGPGTTYRLK